MKDANMIGNYNQLKNDYLIYYLIILLYKLNNFLFLIMKKLNFVLKIFLKFHLLHFREIIKLFNIGVALLVSTFWAVIYVVEKPTLKTFPHR